MAFLLAAAAEMAIGAAWGGGIAAGWYGMQKLFGEDEIPEEKEQEIEREKEAELQELARKHEEEEKRWKEKEQREKEKQREEDERRQRAIEKQVEENERMRKLMEEKMEEQMKKLKQMNDDEKRKNEEEMKRRMKELEQKNDEIKKQNEDIKRMKDEMEEQAKKPPDDREAFRRFAQAVSKEGVTPLYAMRPNIFRIGFLGNVSVGKSSLINALYGKKVAKAGHGQTTLKPTFVGEMKLTMVTETKVHIYDIPGDDSDYSYADVRALRLVNSLDLLVVVFDNTISYTYKVLELAKAFGKHIIFVRNKLDNIENSDDDDEEDDDGKELSWQEELEKDKEHLAKMLPTSVPLPLFGVSARNALKAVKAALKSGNAAAPAPCETYQWNTFMKELINLSEAERNDGTQAGGEVCHNDIRDRP